LQEKKEITLEEIERITAMYKVDIHSKFLPQLKTLYETYLKKCFEDKNLTDQRLSHYYCGYTDDP